MHSVTFLLFRTENVGKGTGGSQQIPVPEWTAEKETVILLQVLKNF